MNREVVNILSEGLSEEQKNYFIDTLKNISENDAASDEKYKYPTESSILAINFDKIKEIYTNTALKNIYRAPKSNDALYIIGSEGNCEWYFIEFKAGAIDNSLTDEIYKKIYDSIIIMLDLKSINNGKLQIENGKGYLLQEKNDNFNFEQKLKKLGFKSEINFIREHFRYILVYNREEYKENDRDKVGYRAELLAGKYEDLENILVSTPWFWREFSSAYNCIEKRIEERKFGFLREQCEFLPKFHDEYKALFDFLDCHDELKEKVFPIQKNIKGKYINMVKDINSQRAEDIFQYMLMNCGMSKQKIKLFNDFVNKVKDLKKLQEGAYNDFIVFLEKRDNDFAMKQQEQKLEYLQEKIQQGDFYYLLKEYEKQDTKTYLQEFKNALMRKSRIPQRCLFLHQFENYLFKEVRTLDMEEFKTSFVDKYERKERNLA